MKPGDFLLGVQDFFAILLPGSMATWLVTRYIPPGELNRALSFGVEATPATPDAIRVWAAFLLASFVLGHFVFMAGSRLDAPYDRWRKREKPIERDKAFQAAAALQEAVTPKLVGGNFSTLKWAKVYVEVEASHARVEIDRLEADSKFFRGMVVVSIALALHFWLRERLPIVGSGALVLTALSYYRYRDQRWKLTELSYATAVIVHAVKARRSAPANRVANATADDQATP